MPNQKQQRATEKASEQIYENVEAVAAVYERVEKSLPMHQRGIESLVAALGRPRVLFGCLTAVVLWLGGNLLALRLGQTPLDPPPFFWLQGVVTLTSLLTTILVLITQNRQGGLTEQRSHLDLQVNLLAERKITKIIALLEELRRDSPSIKDRYDGVAEAMEHPADPQLVIQALEAKTDRTP